MIELLRSVAGFRPASAVVLTLVGWPTLASANPSATSTTTVSAEILELARNLEVLENFDLLVQWDVLQLLPLLEETDER